jgi:hypothetical protein
MQRRRCRPRPQAPCCLGAARPNPASPPTPLPALPSPPLHLVLPPPPRVWARSLWSSEPDFVMEEYNRLDDEGNTIVTRQCCRHYASGRTAVQYLVGEWAGDTPLPGHC